MHLDVSLQRLGANAGGSASRLGAAEGLTLITVDLMPRSRRRYSSLITPPVPSCPSARAIQVRGRRQLKVPLMSPTKGLIAVHSLLFFFLNESLTPSHSLRKRSHFCTRSHRQRPCRSFLHLNASRAISHPSFFNPAKPLTW